MSNAHQHDRAVKPTARHISPPWMNPPWMDLHEKHIRACNEQPDAGLVFVGDSITEGWLDKGIATWQKLFKPRRAVNLGIGGDETSHVRWRLANNPALPALAPDAVVLLIGTNNLGNDDQLPETAAAGITAVCQDLQHIFPETPLFVLSILPRGETPDDELRTRARQTNELIKPLGSRPFVNQADLSQNFLEPDNTISPDIMPDFLHLSVTGYERFGAALTTLL